MKSRSKKAKEIFSDNYNCSQSVLLSFATDFKLSFDLANHISSGFGAGMAYQGETCGAVTGAYMVLGLHSGTKFSNQEDIKDYSYQLLSAFNKRFKELHQCTNCTDLLGTDIGTATGIEEAKEKGLFVSRCPNFVESAVQICEELMQVNHK